MHIGCCVPRMTLVGKPLNFSIRNEIVAIIKVLNNPEFSQEEHCLTSNILFAASTPKLESRNQTEMTEGILEATGAFFFHGWLPAVKGTTKWVLSRLVSTYGSPAVETRRKKYAFQ